MPQFYFRCRNPGSLPQDVVALHNVFLGALGDPRLPVFPTAIKFRSMSQGYVFLFYFLDEDADTMLSQFPMVDDLQSKFLLSRAENPTPVTIANGWIPWAVLIKPSCSVVSTSDTTGITLAMSSSTPFAGDVVKPTFTTSQMPMSVASPGSVGGPSAAAPSCGGNLLPPPMTPSSSAIHGGRLMAPPTVPFGPRPSCISCHALMLQPYQKHCHSCGKALQPISSCPFCKCPPLQPGQPFCHNCGTKC